MCAYFFDVSAISPWSDQVILCDVDGSSLSCSLQLDSVLDPGGVVRVPYPRTVFVPMAPIVMGTTTNLSVRIVGPSDGLSLMLLWEELISGWSYIILFICRQLASLGA